MLFRSGVRIINLDKRGDQIASVCCVESDPEEETDNDIVDSQAEELEGAVDEMLDEMDVEPIDPSDEAETEEAETEEADDEEADDENNL